MNKIAISPAASALLRLLAARARVSRDRILLTEIASADWQSLTFTGERHQMSLRVTGADSREAVELMRSGLEDAEFSIPGLLVADIGILSGPRGGFDGSTELTIEALTIAE